MKEYIFTKYESSDSRGCSCCEPTFMGYYVSDDTDTRLGTPHYEEDCYVHAIITEKDWDVISNDEYDSIWAKDLDDLIQMCDDIHIKVIILED
ncbi:hypothetical protein D3C85_488020 [compost metagenome]